MSSERNLSQVQILYVDRKAAVKYAVDAVNYLMDTAGSSLVAETISRHGPALFS